MSNTKRSAGKVQSNQPKHIYTCLVAGLNVRLCVCTCVRARAYTLARDADRNQRNNHMPLSLALALSVSREKQTIKKHRRDTFFSGTATTAAAVVANVGVVVVAGVLCVIFLSILNYSSSFLSLFLSFSLLS